MKMMMPEMAATVTVAAVLLLATAAGAEATLPPPLELERVPLNGKLLTDLRERDRARHSRVGVVNLPVEGTIAPFSDGLYYTRLKLGNPPRQYTFQLDTGISISWVACKGCKACLAKNTSIVLYNPESSSTSSPISCSNNACAAAQIGSTVCKTGGLCGYSFTYAGDDIVTGYYVSDTMYFNSITGNKHSINSSASVVFGCTKTPLKLMDTDGVLGFGQDDLSFISQLHSQGLSPRVFSHCLKGSEKGGGTFVLGKTVAPGVVYTPLVSTLSSYNLNLESIAVNGHKLPIDSSLFATSNSQGTTVVDSGTALAYIVAGAHGPLVTAITEAIPPSVTPVDASLSKKRDRHDKCFVSSGSMDLLFPTVTLYFKGNAAMTVKPSHYLVQQGTYGNESVWCIGWQSSQALSNIQGLSVTILGDIVLHDKLIVYDLENKQLGWTDYNCSSLNATSPLDVSGTSEYYSGGLIWVAAVWVLLRL
uniref:Uncharacterized protein n=1 Tax=Avena sativa TaxID=4498 RepID=A0ACD5XDA1_AVESA